MLGVGCGEVATSLATIGDTAGTLSCEDVNDLSILRDCVSVVIGFEGDPVDGVLSCPAACGSDLDLAWGSFLALCPPNNQPRGFDEVRKKVDFFFRGCVDMGARKELKLQLNVPVLKICLKKRRQSSAFYFYFETEDPRQTVARQIDG